MKRLILLIALVASYFLASAQNVLEFDIEDYPNSEVYVVCLEDNYQQVIVHAQNGCEMFYWRVNQPDGSYDTYQNIDPLVLDIGDYSYEDFVEIVYHGCNMVTHLPLFFAESQAPAPSTQVVWKRQGESLSLELPYSQQCIYHWSTGETTSTIEVTEPGTYTCVIADVNSCGEPTTTTFIVQDNVELYRATCDLRSNLNQVTWQTTPAQAEYISQVKVYRNTYQLVATVPYLDGSFTDDIGSESTQWQYHVVGVDTNGNDCPIPSYWKRTIHLDHVQGTQGNEILQWTPYQDEQESNSVIAYNIYDVVNGEPNLVMQVGNFTNVYAYNPNDFDGYGTVAAVFVDGSKEYEELAFSNLTADVLGIGENDGIAFRIYPNPAKGRVTVEGSGTLTVTNTLGQTVLTKEIDGQETVTLPKGVYFVQLNGAVRKIVVE